jgi:N-acetyl-anhydromuramyl-L-alanine amidase AmpD
MTRRIDEIFIHCAATRPDWMANQPITAKRAEIDRWHRERGWQNGFGYHYLIDRDGRWIEGRPEDMIGAHVAGRNTHSLGICLVGGFGAEANDQFGRHFTPQQEASLLQLLTALEQRHPNARVRGHNEVANKACPGFVVSDWMHRERAPQAVVPEAAVTIPERTNLSESTTIQATSLVSVASAATPVVAAVGGVPWQNLLILCAITLLVLVASGYITVERVRKWRKGDR